MIRGIYSDYKKMGLISKAEHLLFRLDDTLKRHCDSCNNNVFYHKCLADGTTIEKLTLGRDILNKDSTDILIDCVIDVAQFLTRHSEKLSDIREVYNFEEIENPRPATPEGLQDIETIVDSDECDSPPNRLSTSNYPIQPRHKSKLGKMLSSKRGKVQKQLFSYKPYPSAGNTSTDKHSFQSLGQKLMELNSQYHEKS